MKEKNIKAVVAPGRTVLHEDGRKGVGEIVELVESEFRRLLALGFVTNPEKLQAALVVDRESAAPKIIVDKGENPVEVKSVPDVVDDLLAAAGGGDGSVDEKAG